MSNKLFVVKYHYTRDLSHSRYPEIKGLEADVLRKQFEFFKSKFNIVTMRKVIDAATGKDSLPKDAMLITFDDGYVDNYTIALPLLIEFGMQGSFFIPGKTFSEHKLLDVNKIHYTLACGDVSEIVKDLLERMDYYRGQDFSYPANKELWEEYAQNGRYDCKEIVFVKRMLQTVLPEEIRNQVSSDLFKKYVDVTEEQLAYELYMTKEQINVLKKAGMHIGLHGYDHYWLGNLPEKKMKEDISLALDVMKDFIDRDEWVISYPYGSFNADVVKFVAENGASIAFSDDVGVEEVNVENRFAIPRLDCNDFPPKSENYKKWMT